MTEQNELILKTYCEKIEEQLLEFTKRKESLQGIIYDAMEYSLMAGGKRLRPVLMLEFCRMCGGDVSKYLDIACTIEMIHTFSLIHDDLPCMDNDDYRRGKPSCHKAFPENIALLAGDALNTLAFEVIANAAIEGRISADKAVMLVSVLGKAVGVEGMIGGQVIDLQSEGKSISLETLNVLQEKKTGALIEAACVMGVVLGGKFDKIPTAANYAMALGKAFQIEDDILDVTGSFEELGKPIGSDGEQNKNTYVSILGLEESKNTAKKFTENALKYLDEFDDNDFVCDLTRSMLERRK
ncbi:MAG: polyprenyl synthetase family protein [Oscillospiraceae bacterium]